MSVTRIAQTLGLTEYQTEIIANVRQFVDKEIIPHAQELEHSDTYPQDIVDQMREMGLFGLMIPEEYGGLGESLLTYALCVEELARGYGAPSEAIQNALRCEPPSAVPGIISVITDYGCSMTPEQKAREETHAACRWLASIA